MAQPPGPSEPEELTAALLAAGRTLVDVTIGSLAAAPVEVTVIQHRVLVLLAGDGEHSVGEIAASLGVNASNATRHCDRLERLGLLSRRRSSSDARVVRVALTVAGRRLLDAVAERRHHEILRIVERMSAPDRAAAVQALGAFRAAARDQEEAERPAPPVLGPPAGRR
jgi:DNA-binding MarR family transcriptional regulator